MAVKCLDGPFVFRLNENGTGPHLLIQVCTERGWREYAGDNNVFKDRWNLWWRSGGYPLSHYRPLLPWQPIYHISVGASLVAVWQTVKGSPISRLLRQAGDTLCLFFHGAQTGTIFVNRIPKGSSICRKDNLVRLLRYMKKIYGSLYDFSPVGYNLPSEYPRLAEECSRYEKDDRVWICKPVGQSQGRGIFLFRKLSDLSYDNTAVVQRYIENPLLIGGYKFDLRLYVCVPSYRPLTIYLYKEGLARFATEKFSLEHLEDPFRHLTNFSLNKLGPGYAEKKERIGSGCKWTFRQLRRYFEQSGYSDWLLWQRIACLVSLTILSQATGVPKSSNCFEFFGFDVLIDENLKPWLLEVNVSPALSNDCEIDSEVKKPLLHDLFDLLGLPVCNTGLSLFTIWSTERTDRDVEVSSKYCTGRSTKRKSKLARETDGFLNVCPDIRPTIRQSAPDISNPWSRYDPLLVDKYVPRGFRGNNVEESGKTFMWDNGRDWRTPCATEGGWVRIYPFSRSKPTENVDYMDSMNSEKSRNVEKEVKNTIFRIQKYLKTAKDVQKKNEKLTDEQCNTLLRASLDLSTEIWLPEK